jgi:hypothetical protein
MTVSETQKVILLRRIGQQNVGTVNTESHHKRHNILKWTISSCDRYNKWRCTTLGHYLIKAYN